MSSSWFARCARQCTHEYVRWHLLGRYAWNVFTILGLLPSCAEPDDRSCCDPDCCVEEDTFTLDEDDEVERWTADELEDEVIHHSWM